MKNRIIATILATLFVFTFSICASFAAGGKTPKNVIMIIGDGMGPEQVGFLMSYARQAPDSTFKDGKTAFDRIMDDGGTLGLSMTHAYIFHTFYLLLHTFLLQSLFPFLFLHASLF